MKPIIKWLIAAVLIVVAVLAIRDLRERKYYKEKYIPTYETKISIDDNVGYLCPYMDSTQVSHLPFMSYKVNGYDVRLVSKFDIYGVRFDYAKARLNYWGVVSKIECYADTPDPKRLFVKLVSRVSKSQETPTWTEDIYRYAVYNKRQGVIMTIKIIGDGIKVTYEIDD